MTGIQDVSEFAGRTALVTGGARGIGGATVDRLRNGGARVAVFDRDISAVDDEILALSGDVTRSSDVDSAVARVMSEMGRLDILVCCAGIFGASLRTVDVPDEELERVFAVNAYGTFYANRAAIRCMTAAGYGRIVNVSSTAGKEGNPLAAAYSGAKAAVMALTQAMARDVAREGILINCVAPAVVHTPLIDDYVRDLTQDQIDYMVARVPLGRMGTPQEVATLIAFLASEAVTFSTGACFDVSGGRAAF
jgi:NAD(P)-dependent dehydrogenase (short-subunit alcohol dehydrogenase family)